MSDSNNNNKNRNNPPLKFRTIRRSEIRLNKDLQVFITSNNRFNLTNINFLYNKPDGKEILTNHYPQGLYINVLDILEFIRINLKGIDGNSPVYIDK